MSQALTITRSKLFINPIPDIVTKERMRQASLDNLYRGGSYNGFISRRTTTRIERMVENMVTAIEQFKISNRRNKLAWKIRPTFVTLTLSYKQFHKDNVIKRQLFSRFIDRLKKDKGVQFYIWRAEPQENGNIHFHILCDRFIEWEWIRNVWNGLQSRLEYIDAFEQKNGHRNPNSTDVHELKKINHVARYICKYMTKDKPLRKIDGRIWGCSSDFHKLRNPKIELCKELYNEIFAMKRAKILKEKVCEFVSILSFKSCEIVDCLSGFINTIYQDFVTEYLTSKIIIDGT